MSLKSTVKWTGLPKSRLFSNVIPFFGSCFLSRLMFQKKDYKSTERVDLQEWLSSCIQVAWHGIERPPYQFSLQAASRNENLAPQSGAFGSLHADDGCSLAEEPWSGGALCGCESCHIKSSNFFNHFPFKVSNPLTY